MKLKRIGMRLALVWSNLKHINLMNIHASQLNDILSVYYSKFLSCFTKCVEYLRNIADPLYHMSSYRSLDIFYSIQDILEFDSYFHFIRDDKLSTSFSKIEKYTRLCNGKSHSRLNVIITKISFHPMNMQVTNYPYVFFRMSRCIAHFLWSGWL